MGGGAGREQDGADGLLARTLYDTDLRRDKLTCNLAPLGPQTFKCGLTLIRHSPLISVFPPARDSAAHETPRVGSLKGGRLLSARCSVRVSRTGHQISNFQA